MNARRVYAYLVSAVSFIAIFFAANSLLHSLLIPNLRGPLLEMAGQIAILVVGLPIYLGHWLWQQRLAARDAEERSAIERRTYLYVIMAAMVVTMLVVLYDLVETLLDRTPFGTLSWSANTSILLESAITLALAALAWAYHAALHRADAQEEPDRGAAGTVRRLYLYGFSTTGLIMVLLSVHELLRWLLYQLEFLGPVERSPFFLIESQITQLIIGVPLWLLFGRWAQRLFDSGEPEERESILRKFLLYLGVFVGVVGAVATSATLLAGIFRSLLGLEPQGDLRDALALIITFSLLWLYQSLVLRSDERAASSTDSQREIRRIYLYLLAAIGLVALVVGITGDVVVLIRTSIATMDNVDREALAYYTAALIAGLPVWYLAWRQAQQETAQPDNVGSRARRSVSRRIYLYLFLFISMMGILGGAIAVVYHFVRAILGSRVDVLDLAIPIAISLIQLLVWLYHWATLRGDQKLEAELQTRRLEDLRLILLDDGSSTAATGLIWAVAERLYRVSPGIQARPVQVEALAATAPSPVAAAEIQETALSSATPAPVLLAESLPAPASAGPSQLPELTNRLADAEVVIAPWTLFVPGGDNDEARQHIAHAVSASSARKLLLPALPPGYSLLGLDPAAPDKAAQEVVDALKRIAAGEEVRSSRRLGCGAIALIVVGVLLLISLVSSLASTLIYSF